MSDNLDAVTCPECGTNQLANAVDIGRQLLGYFPFTDAEGHEHFHDGNGTCVAYKCVNGHEWKEYRWRGTCWCGWSAAIEQAEKVAQTRFVQELDSVDRYSMAWVAKGREVDGCAQEGGEA